MLKIKYLFEDFAFAKKALNYYFHDEERLDEALSWYRISSNAIYPYFDQQQLCFLRIAPVSEKDLANLKGELAYLTYLHEHDFPALELILTKDQQELLELDGYYVSAFKGVPGEPLDDIEIDEAIMFKYGETLGLLHNISEEMPHIPGKWDNETVLKFIGESFCVNKAPESMKSRLTQLSEDLRTISQSKRNYGMIHYDYEPDNVFYDQASQKCYVIDFDDAIYSFYYFDVIRALAEIDDDPMEKEFLKGYQAVRQLSVLEQTENEKIAPVLQELWRLYSYARIMHALSDQGVENPEWKINLVKRMQQRLQKIENEK